MSSQVESTQPVTSDGKHGYGFVVRDDRGQQCMTVAFESEMDAKTAEVKLRDLLANALFVRAAR